MKNELKNQPTGKRDIRYEYIFFVILLLIGIGTTYLFSFPRVSICSDQLEIWIGIFLAYISLSAIISVVFVYWVQSTGEEGKRDYRRTGKVVSQDRIHFRLLNYLVFSFCVFVIALALHAAIRIWIIVLLFTISLIIPSIVMLYRLISKMYMVIYKRYKLIDLSKRRLCRILETDLSTVKHEYVSLNVQYVDEVDFVTKIVRVSIRDNRIELAKEGMRWLTDVVVSQIQVIVPDNQIHLIGVILSAVRDSYARIIMEAANFKFQGHMNRGLLEDMLVRVELSSQEFIKPAYSQAFQYIIDSFQLAYGNAPKSFILEKYISFFIDFGNLRAAIKVLDEPKDKQEYKLAVLNSSLVLICYSFRSPDCSASCARLINMLPNLDITFLKDEESAEDYTGLGCWLLVFRLMKRISESNPNEEICESARIQHEAMLAKTIAPEFSWDYLDEARTCIQTHKNQILESSTGSSFYFCITDYLPGYHGRIDSYVIRAIEFLREYRQRNNE